MSHDLDKILQAFTDFAVLQSVSQVIRKLDENGVPIDEFHEWIKIKAHGVRSKPPNVLKKIPWNELPRVKVMRACPKCGKLLNLAEVNVTTNTQVGEGYQSQWFCRSGCGSNKRGCDWEEYSTNSIWEESLPYMVRV